MIATTFDYERVTSVADAISKLRESNGDAKLLAGGHSLLPMMKLRLASPTKLIDISGLPELRGIAREPNGIVVGALTTHREIAQSQMVRDRLAVLSEAASRVGDLQVRNRGTLGGNLAHADMASDLPAVALALEADINIITMDGEETIPAEEFFLGPLLTALPEQGVIKNVTFKLPPASAKSVYEKVPHPASGYAVVGVAAVVAVDSENVVTHVRIGITGAADLAYRALSVEEALLGQDFTLENIQAAASHAADDGVISEDVYASEEYRRQLCKVHTARALKRLAGA